VKYSGNLDIIGTELNAVVEPLNNSYAIITLDESKLDNLYNYRQIEFIERPKNLAASQALSNANAFQASCITTVLNNGKLNGEGTIVAILDSGIDYKSREFVDSNGNTRIINIWDQTIEGTPPEPFKIGNVYNTDEINGGDLQTVDELGHGTSVAAIAVGSTIGVARGANILVVKLPNAPKTTHLMRAVSYSVNKARELSMPIVINISFGTNDGSHDGFSLFERFIDDMSNEWKTNIIVAMGNEGDSGRHFSATIKESQTIDVEFFVANNISELNMTLWQNFVDEFSFEVYGPNGLVNDKVFINVIVPNFLTPAQEINFRLQSPAPGTWRLRVFGKKIVVGTFDIWLPISERTEAYFFSPNVETTLTIPATSFSVISVGAYNSLLDIYASFSGRGYTRVFNNVKPDIVAPGVSIYTASPNNTYDPKTGTSFATPLVTGSVSLLQQWGIVQGNNPLLYGQSVKAYLRKGATRTTNLTYPNPQWGYGRLCLSRTLDLVMAAGRTVPAMAVMPSNVSSDTNVVEKIMSEDYIEFAVRINSYVTEFVNSNPDVFLTTLLTQYGILYMPASMGAEFERVQGKYIVYGYPKNLGLMGREAIEASNITTVQSHPYLNLRGNGALVAIIDTGIDYTNESFVYEDNSTKIQYLWDQTVEDGKPPEGFLYGHEYSASEITEALQTSTPLDITDEIGHGTNLAAIAAGREIIGTNKIGAAPDSSLIIVKLRQAKNSLKELVGINPEKLSYSSTDLMTAVEYVRNKAVQLNKPISICIGMGTNEGSHDGLGLFEGYLSDMAIKNGVVIQAAMGNEGRARTHYKGTLHESGEVRDIEFRVGEGETGIAIYIYANEPDIVSVSITSPTGEFINTIPSRDQSFSETTLLLEKSIVGVRYDFASEKNATESIFIRILKPTPGLWNITIRGILVIDGTLNMWLPVTNFITQDTYFLEPTAEYTGVMPSTSNNIIAVGGYDSESNILYVGTSRGPTRLGLPQPSIVAPAVNVLGVTPLTGTSAAAAVTTGASALLLEWAIAQGNYPIFNSVRARSYLTAGASRRENLEYPNNQWGYGILNLFATFETMRRQ